ncbi:MAG: GAF domain-containing protein [Gammaproteobacteria bacterium]
MTTGSTRKTVAALERERAAARAAQAATAEILAAMTANPGDPQPVFAAIARHARLLAGAVGAVATRLQGDTLHLVGFSTARGYKRRGQKTLANFPRPLDGSAVNARAILTRRPAQIADIVEAEGLDFELRQRVIQFGARSLLAVPLLHGEETLGSLLVARAAAGTFDDELVGVLQGFAGQAAMALANARLFNETREALERQTATGEVLAAIGSSVADTAPVFEKILDGIESLVPDSIPVVLLIDEHQRIDIAACRGIPEEIARAPFPCPVSETPTALAIAEKRVLHYPDVAAEAPPQMKSRLATIGNHAIALAPMIFDGRGIGSLGVVRIPPRPFLDKELALLKTFSDQAAIAVQNARLFNDTRQALKYQTATAEILRVISRSVHDSVPVFQKINESCRALFAADVSGVVMVGEDGLAYNVASAFEGRVQSPPPDPDSRTLAMIKARQVWHIPDSAKEKNLTRHQRLLARKMGPFAMVLVPMIWKDQGIGAIWLGRFPPRPFSADEIDLLKTFCDQAVIAINNARLFKDVHDALARQTATAEVLEVISSSPTDVQPVFEAILARALALAGARLGTLLRYDDGQLRVTAVGGFSPAAETGYRARYPHAPDPRVMMDRAVIEHAVIHVPDVLALGDDYPLAEWVKGAGVRNLLAVPMMRGTQCIGVIGLTRSEPGLFSDEHVRLLQTFAAQAVIAIDNTRLFNDTQEALERQTATAEVLEVISSSPTDVQPVFEAIAERAAALCGADLGGVLRHDGMMVDVAAIHGWSPQAEAEYRAVYPHAPHPGMLLDRPVLDGRILHLADILDDPVMPSGMRDLRVRTGMRGMLGVPMLSAGRCIGVIGVGRKEVGLFSSQQVQLLETFAAQAVIAIENARLFNETQEALERQTALSEVLQVIGSSVEDPAPVFDKVLDSCHALIDCEELGLFVVREDGLVDLGAPWRGYGREGTREFLAAAFPRPVEGTLVEIATRGRRTLHYPHVSADNDPSGLLGMAAQHFGEFSIVIAPMLWEDRGVGTLTAVRIPPRPFARADIDLITTFAGQAVIAIENARLFHQIKDKSRQLEAANRHKSEFLANMSHELRTPLNAVIGFSEVLIERMFGDLNDKQEDYLKDIHASGKHLLSLINDILDLSKIEAGRMELDVEDFDLRSALENTLTLVRERAERHGIALALEAAEDLDGFRADQRKFKQVMLNLLSNAVKFTPDGGRITVRARLAAPDLLEVAVADTGIGIAPEYLETIFEEFRQAGGSYTNKQEGTGLGLSLTRRIVELHGGRIGVDSEPGAGATFTFTLPRQP